MRRKTVISHRIDIFQDSTVDENLFGIFDSTILLTSRAIGVGFLYFPSHTQWPVFLTGK